MDNELLDKLTGLTLLGYYDTDLKLLCVHFFGDQQKHDLVAYLKHDLTWDLREVLSESVQLFDDHSTVQIQHSRLGTYAAGTGFDRFIRQALKQLIDQETLVDQKVGEVLDYGYQHHQTKLD